MVLVGKVNKEIVGFGRYLDRTSVTRISELNADMGEVTVVGRVVGVQVKGFAKGQRCEAVLVDGSGRMSLVWFNRVAWVQKLLDEIGLSGKRLIFTVGDQTDAATTLLLKELAELGPNPFKPVAQANPK